MYCPFSEFEKGKKNGYTPVILCVDRLLAETIDYNYRAENDITQYRSELLSSDLSYGKSFLKNRLDEQLEGFKEVVAEPAIEFTFDRLDFLLTFLRKGIAEVLPHDFPPVSYHIIYNDEKKVRQSIQHPEREDGQEINKSVNYIIHYLYFALILYKRKIPCRLTCPPFLSSEFFSLLSRRTTPSSSQFPVPPPVF